ncbi:hypothetical protein DM02DRAFT_617192 [Periconia macrospinosa]|uniref:Uncharacterized protein n=1 Tax=Periconia macrospinosa TaxID=97972 RepID=A0A2V1DEM4_9PLEO|nr:hypothetical protein DM02DRAFT_617192 [Periconia macrospinosa]
MTQHPEYTVRFICALLIELAVAIPDLDEIQETPPTSISDTDSVTILATVSGTGKSDFLSYLKPNDVPGFRLETSKMSVQKVVLGGVKMVILEESSEVQHRDILFGHIFGIESDNKHGKLWGHNIGNGQEAQALPKRREELVMHYQAPGRNQVFSRQGDLFGFSMEVVLMNDMVIRGICDYADPMRRMMSSWDCCQCGNGVYNVAANTGCTQYHYNQCSNCKNAASPKNTSSRSKGSPKCGISQNYILAQQELRGIRLLPPSLTIQTVKRQLSARQKRRAHDHDEYPSTFRSKDIATIHLFLWTEWKESRLTRSEAWASSADDYISYSGLLSGERNPAVEDESIAASQRTFSSVVSDKESVFSALLGTDSVPSTECSYDNDYDCTLETTSLLPGVNETLLGNLRGISSMLGSEDEMISDRGGFLHCPVSGCNMRPHLCGGIHSGKGRGKVIFADGQIPGHNDFMADAAHDYWTWSPEEGNWWHQDEEKGAIVWAPLDFD